MSVLHKHKSELEENRRNFVLYTHKKQRKLLKEIIERHMRNNAKNSKLPKATNEEVEDVLTWINKQKSRGKLPGDFLKNTMERLYFQEYQQRMKQEGAIDFTDMIILATDLLRTKKNILKQYTTRYQHVLVDEFQDLNPIQFNVLKLLIQENKQVSIVGDDDQSIYGFRGGTSTLFNEFRKLFPNHTEKQLERNYRSTQMIVQASQGAEIRIY